ncbi:MAG: hypothetical protein WCP68_00360 [Enhydrobacter sp.]
MGSVVLSFSGVAQAYDGDRDHRWERDHRYERHVERRYDHYDHRRFVEERPVIVRERAPMIVERPVFMAPQPVYQQPGPSGLNLNFNIPLN